MRANTWTVVAVTVLGLLLSRGASAERDRQHAERESKYSRQEIDDAITAAQDSAKTLNDVVDKDLENGRKDGTRREAFIRSELTELLNALDRLRQDFDQDKAWSDQRAEVRTSYAKIHELDSLLRAHWASDARDEWEDAHGDIRKLTKIYEVEVAR